MILSPDRLARVGQLRKSHGVDGALRAVIEEPFRDTVWDTEFLFLEIDGDHVPFAIEYVKGDEENPVFKFEWVNTPEEAAGYAGCELYIEKDQLPENYLEPSDDLEYGFLEGFILIDERIGLIGPILDIEAYPQQEMAIVNHREKEWLIPLHEDLVISIDHDNRQLVMQLPEGLLEE